MYWLVSDSCMMGFLGWRLCGLDGFREENTCVPFSSSSTPSRGMYMCISSCLLARMVVSPSFAEFHREWPRVGCAAQIIAKPGKKLKHCGKHLRPTKGESRCACWGRSVGDGDCHRVLQFAPLQGGGLVGGSILWQIRPYLRRYIEIHVRASECFMRAQFLLLLSQYRHFDAATRLRGVVGHIVSDERSWHQREGAAATSSASDVAASSCAAVCLYICRYGRAGQRSIQIRC